jgi:cation diffusion facilitator family transporter
MSSSGGAKAIVAAFAANLGIAVAKLAGFLVTGSSSMLAESIHSLADTGNQGLLLLGRRRSRRSADVSHPFGYGRERFFWAFVVALVLFSLGALFAIFEGVEKIVHPHEVESPTVAIAILAVAIVLEGFSMRTALAESKPMREDRTLFGFVRTTKVPELPVVLLEDFGALIGLVVAFAALMLTWQVDPVFDGVGTLIIGLLLGVIAVLLAVEMKSLLIGEAASPEDLAAIREAIVADDDVSHLIHIRTEHVGAEEILVAAKIGLEPGLDLPGTAAAIDRVEASIRAVVPAAELIYLEPDLYRDERASLGGHRPES